MSRRILIAEDDARIASFLDKGLRANGFVTEVVADGDDAYAFAISGEFDDATKHARQAELMEYVYEHGELMQAAGPALVTVQAIRNHFGDTPRARKAAPLSS